MHELIERTAYLTNELDAAVRRIAYRQKKRPGVVIGELLTQLLLKPDEALIIDDEESATQREARNLITYSVSGQLDARIVGLAFQARTQKNAAVRQLLRQAIDGLSA